MSRSNGRGCFETPSESRKEGGESPFSVRKSGEDRRRKYSQWPACAECVEILPNHADTKLSGNTSNALILLRKGASRCPQNMA